MLDNTALQQLVEQQIKIEVADKIQQSMNEAWLKSVEDSSIKFIQDRIVAKFANSEALPELVAAVKTSVRDLFSNGQLPGIGQFVDHDQVKQSINDKTQELIESAIAELSIDAAWLEKIEKVIAQHTVRQVLERMATVDVRPIIKESVASQISDLKADIFQGIQCQSESVELTIMDQHVVVENNFTATDITAVNSVVVKDLVVKGSINTDNQSWAALSDAITEKTFNKLNDQWKDSLAQQVAEYISNAGIDFSNIKVGGDYLVKDGKLSNGVVDSGLRSVGTLQTLTVDGDVSLNDTVNVSRRRVGINTQEPDMALSLWDEEVTISAGKFKNQTGYIGTTRKQGLVVGINKTPAIEIDETGLTAIKRVQIGLHKISHGTEVPNYAGTKGDVVFNADPTVENPVFAWQCLGGFRWKVIKAVA